MMNFNPGKIGVKYLVLFLLEFSHASLTASSSPSECGSVFLTASSLQLGFNWFKKNPARDDRLELNWDLSQCNEEHASIIPNQIALFDVDPRTSNDSTPLEIIFTKDHIYEFYTTDISIGNFQLPGEWNKKNFMKGRAKIIPPGPQCLPFWIASFRDEQLLKTDCLKIQPTWMADIREHIDETALTKMLLPGTHNAGSYEFSPVSMRDIFERFTLCQDTDIWTQLVFGIRYLDFRVSYQLLDREKLWLNHGMVRVRPLRPLLDDIRRFLDSTTDEIVILDIHQLPVGFYQSDEIIMDRHHLLLDMFLEVFDDHILPYAHLMGEINHSVGPKVSEILKSGKRLIIGYPDRTIYNQNNWLWPRVRHMWGNTNDPHQLKIYLDGIMNLNYRPTELWSAMAQTTPTALDVVLGTTSLRRMADEVNRNLTRWVQYEWYNKAAIVSSDFFLANNIINLAVHFNSVKGQIMKTVLGKMLYNY